MTAVLAIIGVIVLALVLFIGWGVLKLAGDIDQDREERFGERRS